VRIRSWLIDNGIDYRGQECFDKLVNPETGYKLRVDFYLPKEDIAIEFDGQQHFYPVKFGGRSEEDAIACLAKVRRLDGLKDTFFANKETRLIRIKYTELENIFDILQAEIFECI